MVKRHLFLYGPPGSGKSSTGEALAKMLDLAFIDLDTAIERQTGRRIADIFEKDGEKAFRALESAVLHELAAYPSAAVVALGGGALLAPENRKTAETIGEVVCLGVDEDTLLANIQRQPGKRPLLNGDESSRLWNLLSERREHYTSFRTINVEGRSIEQVASVLQVAFGRFVVRGMGQPYKVLVQEGYMDRMPDLLIEEGLKGPFAVVSDSHVAPLYGENLVERLKAAGMEAFLVRFAAGEENKHMGTVGEVWDAFLAGRLERGSTVIGLGGGVVTDLAGFAAATYQRGTAWVACPTSLLGMVDASVGGKTGVDLPQGKNLVGAFHSPRMVLAETAALETLPEAELRNGMAEVLKHGVIEDPELFRLCLMDEWQGQLGEIVRRALAVKIRVILEDPYEGGRRAVLNLGHTVGHALERESGFRLRHGEAVGLGMLAEAQIAARTGLAEESLAEELAEGLAHLGLPLAIPAGIDLERAMMYMERDKKRAGGTVRFALPVRIGDVRYGQEAARETVLAVLQEMAGGTA